jgi:hypothetical protein
MLLPHKAIAASSSGTIQEANGDFWALRDGRRVYLTVGSDVFEFDIIETGASGSGKVRFSDNSELELRSNTRINVKEVVFTNQRIDFNLGVAAGVARFVTGAIVRRNPDRYKVTTPRTTLGIRGTTFTVSVNGMSGLESVSVEAMDSGHYVIVRNTSTRQVATITGIGIVFTGIGNYMATEGEAHLGEPDRDGYQPNLRSGIDDYWRDNGGGENNGDSDHSLGPTEHDCCGDF